MSLDDAVIEFSGVDEDRRILLYLILSFTTLLILLMLQNLEYRPKVYIRT